MNPRPCWASEEDRAELLWRGGKKSHPEGRGEERAEDLGAGVAYIVRVHI